MKKVFVLPAGEDWIVDRFVNEWTVDNGDITVANPRDCDVVWLFADWCWSRVSIGFLSAKKVLTTIHHVVPDKFGPAQRQEFLLRDRYTTAYHVPNTHTESFIKELTDRPIHVVPYWANNTLFKLVTLETIKDVAAIKPTKQRL